MKESGRIKERYEFSFDARQLGLVLMAVTAIAALVFVLGVSVGAQWERKRTDETGRAVAADAGRPAQKTRVPAAVPGIPAAPPVLAPVTTARVVTAKPLGGHASTKSDAGPGKQEQPVSLTFPKVLTSNGKSTAPLIPDKKAKTPAQKYTVQVGAYKDKGAAMARVDKLRKKGYDAKEVYDPEGGKGYAYKVRVGSFVTRAEAAVAARKLRVAEKASPYITIE